MPFVNQQEQPSGFEELPHPFLDLRGGKRLFGSGTVGKSVCDSAAQPIQHPGF